MFVCCQVEVSATSWSLVHRSPTDCGASLFVITKPRERGGHSRRWAAEPGEIITNNMPFIMLLIGVRPQTAISVSDTSINSHNLFIFDI
jgi:hypothetical protein